MAGECPHSSPLLTIDCYDGSSLVASNHQSYLKIIGDLKNDLEQLSCEVVMVQKECSDQHQGHETDDVGFENSLKELATQNDQLEQALKLQTQTQGAALTELEINNKTLKCQIDRLNRLIFERDQRIVHLSGIIKNICQIQTTEPKQAALEYVTSRNNFTAELERKIEKLSQKLDDSTRQEQFLNRETRKLTEELNESRRKNMELVTQAHRASELLKRHESNRLDLAAKYDTLEQNYEDQTKKLRTANNQLCVLDDRFQTMEKRQFEQISERNLLREEVLSLKEKHACAMGRQKSLQDQITKMERELYNAHEVIKEQKLIMQRHEYDRKAEQNRMQEANSQLKQKLDDLTKCYKQLQDEYEKQNEINSQHLKLLENFRQWRDQQLKADKSVAAVITAYKDNIKGLLEERQKLSNKFRDLYEHYKILQIELHRSKSCPLSLLNTSERLVSAKKVTKMPKPTSSKLFSSRHTRLPTVWKVSNAQHAVLQHKAHRSKTKGQMLRKMIQAQLIDLARNHSRNKNISK